MPRDNLGRTDQNLIAARTVFRIWNVARKEWWAPNWRERTTAATARDVFWRRHNAESKVAEMRNRADLVVVECDLVPRDPFLRELIERSGAHVD